MNASTVSLLLPLVALFVGEMKSNWADLTTPQYSTARLSSQPCGGLWGMITNSILAKKTRVISRPEKWVPQKKSIALRRMARMLKPGR